VSTKLADVRRAFQTAVGSHRDTEAVDDVLNAVMEVMPTVLAEARLEERTEIADRLHQLGEYRMEYVVGVGGEEPQDSTAIMMLQPRGMAQVVYGEATGARNLARIIRGEIDDKGWLPSWRWGD
jgi:hypothetical protein